MLVVFGSVALDTTRTPKKTLKDKLGGASTFAAISASSFTKTGLVAVVGSDLPQKDYQTLASRVMVDGLVKKPGKTFRYDCKYDKTLSVRTTLKTQLNVLEGFKPTLPETYASSKYVYLANSDPDQNLEMLGKFTNKVRFSMCDTIDFWIKTKRASVIKIIKKVDAAIMNDEEAILLAKGEHNLLKCAKKIRAETGVKYLIIKKGPHGSLLFYGDNDAVVVVAAPAYTLEGVVDPTGAGDAFAGAVMGYLANLNKPKVSIGDLRRSLVYGNVMGSFTVEGYGLDGLLKATNSPKSIEKRAKMYIQSLPL